MSPRDKPKRSVSVRKMDPARFTIGERVRYLNHVASYDIATLEVMALDDEFVFAYRLLDRANVYKFTHDGIATWSPNLSIQHEALGLKPANGGRKKSPTSAPRAGSK